MLFKRPRKRSRYAEDVDSERKSFDEKSTAVRGKTVNLRRADLASRRDNAAESESTRLLDEDVPNEVVIMLLPAVIITDVNSL